MVEINPVVLLAAGTIVVGVVTFMACARGGKRKSEGKPAQAKEAEAVPVVAASKPKKRSKPRNRSKKSADGKEVAGSSSEAEVAAPTSAPTRSVVEQAKEEEEEEDKHEDHTEDIFVRPDSSAKPKKAKETQEQKASRLERQKQQKPAKKADEDVVFFSEAAGSSSAAGGRYMDHTSHGQSGNGPTYDGWAVVENTRKLKKKSESTSDLDDIPPLMANTPITVAPPSAPAVVASEEAFMPPPVDSVTREVSVEARKLGLLIGPKGVTKIGMQTATGTEITMPKVEKDVTGLVTVTVTGPAAGVDRAVHALNELCTKGYCNLLASPDFHEGYVEVKPRFLPDIIGKGGSSIRAIQAHTGVKISTPSDYTRTLPSGETVVPSKVRIILAGNRDKIAVARGLILDLCKYFYTPVTHPGLTHIEMDVAPNYYNYIIGSKGSEIKHIQANYKVTVYIPNAESANQNLLIVGDAANTASAEQHIQRLIQKVDERAKAEAEGIALGESAKAKMAATAAAGGAGTGAGEEKPRRDRERAPRAPRADRDAPADPNAPRSKGPKDPNAPDLADEAWTAEYAPRRAPIDLGAMLPASAKFSAAPAAVSPVTPDAEPALGAAL